MVVTRKPAQSLLNSFDRFVVSTLAADGEVVCSRWPSI